MSELPKIQIALYLSESFAEIIAKSEKLELKKRWFWATQKPATILKEILNQKEFNSPNCHIDFIIGLRYIEKVFDRRLSGNVAQVVTSGFENWVYLRQPLEGAPFSPTSQRRAPLANPDLIFSLNERIDAEGNIIQPLLESDLEAISAKLKLMKVEKVSLNLLYGQKHSQHQKVAFDYFTQQGFKVFIANHHGGREDEAHRWRRNLMNAGMSGSIDEIIADLKATLTELCATHSIQIATTKGFKSELNSDDYLDSLMGVWSENCKTLPSQTSGLYFGIEKFIWYSTEQKTAWVSPWGPVNIKSPEVKYLKFQPTLRLDSGWLSEVEISNIEEGFEPGPMCLGRAVKGTVFDIWACGLALSNVQSLETILQQTGKNRFLDLVKVWLRTAKKIGSKNENDQIQELLEETIELLALEIDLLPGHQDLIAQGPMANVLVPLIHPKLKNKKLILDKKIEGFHISMGLLNSYNIKSELHESEPT